MKLLKVNRLLIVLVLFVFLSCGSVHTGMTIYDSSLAKKGGIKFFTNRKEDFDKKKKTLSELLNEIHLNAELIELSK